MTLILKFLVPAVNASGPPIRSSGGPTGRRDRLRAFFRPRAVNVALAPTPLPRPPRVVPGPQGTSTSTSATALAPPILTPALPAPQSNVAALPVPHTYVGSVWDQALDALSDADRQIVNFGQLNKLEVLDQLTDVLKARRDSCIQKQWKFTYRGKTIILRDVADKLLGWVNKFKEIGDIIVSLNPIHAALPWAAFRFLLKVAEDDSEKMGLVLVAIERVGMVLARCAIFEKLYFGGNLTLTQGLEKSLVLLYAAVLTYLARAIRYFTHNTAGRIALAAFDVEGLQPILDQIDECDLEVGKEVDIVEGESQRMNSGEITGGIAQLRLMLDQLEKPMMRIDGTVTAIFDNLQKSERAEILMWLSNIPYQKHHERAKEARLKGTGHWLLQKGVFKEWQRSSASNILWLHGIPGAGKTKLISLVVDELLHHLEAVNDEGFAYFYCARHEVDRQDPDAIFRAILKQLSHIKTGCIHPLVVEHYRASKREGFPTGDLAIAESTDLILKLLQVYPKTTIVIDALDECDLKRREDLFESLQKIVMLTANLVKIFVSSRDDTDITRQYAALPNLYIQAKDNVNDINAFVDYKIDESIRKRKLLNGKLSPELKRRIVRTISDGANGMFLWADLQIKTLCELHLESDVRARLGALPATLEETYTEIFDTRISTLQGNGRLLAYKALMWIMCSSEPLSPVELVAGSAIALQMESASPRVGNDDVDIELIIDICHNLVVVDQQLDVVRFAHLSVLEYLEKRQWDAVTIHTMAVEVCIYTLNDPAAHSQWLHEEFLYYSTHRWSYHFERCEQGRASTVLANLLRAFLGEFDNPSPAYSVWFESLDSTSHVTTFETNPTNSMIAAAAFGVGTIVSELWDASSLNPNLTAEDNYGSTALYIASAFQQEWVVQKLLECGADSFQAGGRFGDSLQAAAVYGNIGIFKLLLVNGAKYDTQLGHWGSALQAAAYAGRTDMMSSLLDFGADIDIPGGHAGSPLLAAAISRSPNICGVVRFLLDKGANIFARGPFGSLLEIAALEGMVDVIPLLVSELKSRGVTNHSAAACAAVRANSLQSLRAIIEAGGEIHIPENETSKTPLHCSIMLMSPLILEFLTSYMDPTTLAVNLRSVGIDEIEWAHGLQCFSLIQPIVTARAARVTLALTPREVLRARIILSDGLGLPIPIADRILNLAEYWVRTTVTVAREVDITEDSPYESYIRMTVCSRSTVTAPVRKIVFHITSHDQGWSDDTDNHGTYRQSFTWFQAAIVPSHSLAAHSPSLQPVVQHNVHASAESRTHVVTWDTHSDAWGAQYLAWDRENITWDSGNYSFGPRWWITGLHHGSQLVVYPKALYCGWSNTVLKISIDLYCAWV